MSTTDSKIVPRLVIIVLGLSGALLALGALIGLSESHAGTADMVRHGWIQLFVGASSVVWSFVAAVRWRTTSPMLLSPGAAWILGTASPSCAPALTISSPLSVSMIDAAA